MVVVQVACHAFPAASQAAFRAYVALAAYRVAYLAYRVEEVEMVAYPTWAFLDEEASWAFQVGISFLAALVAFHVVVDHLAFVVVPICQVEDDRYSIRVLLLDPVHE